MTTPTHTIIVSSRCANHTSDQVVKAIREVVDAREMGVGVDRVRKARNQKVVLSCASQEAIKRIEARIKIRSKDLQVTKPEPALPLVIIRDVLKINSDQDIVDSLRGQNSHITGGLEWEKDRGACPLPKARKKPSGMSPSSGGFTCAIHPPHKSRPHICGAAAKTGVGSIAPSTVLALPRIRPQQEILPRKGR
ncbi:hypothetical protein EVAR_11048_1 [Eumeta japonica]|uniref:Uncharacterized protein n=1 Tax=Eumeta variegata TaxID=151549 RepID=A0A4C1U4G7_EUMVA|nr:hypothetical protein EVAR_11048_1 [Eumeta japonica]